MCRACALRFGLPPDRPTVEAPPRPCARCGHGELVACVARQRLSDGRLAPLAATYERKLKTPILTGEEYVEYEAAPDPSAPIAVFIAQVCRGCGFTEWYALDPAAIPIGPAYATRLIVVRGPYR